jgi:hypothetical protein
METPLNNKQRKFLEYIRDNHRCVGWNVTVTVILQTGKYDVHSMSAVLADWDLLCRGSIDSRLGYGTPIKYLKREHIKV